MWSFDGVGSAGLFDDGCERLERLAVAGDPFTVLVNEELVPLALLIQRGDLILVIKLRQLVAVLQCTRLLL